MTALPVIPARRHGAAANLPPTRIVIHGTVSPSRDGQAAATGRYFQHVDRPASAHVVTDPGGSVRCLPDAVIGYHAPPNTHSLGHELCDPQAGDPRRWGDDPHQAMLRRAAVIDAAWCVRYGIPIRRLTVAQVKARQRGLCEHHDVSRAFRLSTHVDVGLGFPWPAYLKLVKAEAAKLQKVGGGTPVKAPSKPRSSAAKVLGRLVVDGDMGPATWRKLGANLPGANGTSSHRAITIALQRALHVHTDGAIGPVTTKALQRHLGVHADGVWGPNTTKALQRNLNSGKKW